MHGNLAELEGNLALVDCNGVGYEVMLPEMVVAALPGIGEPTTLIVRQIFREDGTTLYGFVEPFQRRIFDLLLGVNGCGPKAALALIGQVGCDAVATAVLAQDSRMLMRATGVGAKLAERIILELKNRIHEEALLRKIETQTAKSRKPEREDELVDALLALGYRRAEAESAAIDARTAADGVQDQLRHALRVLKR